MKQYIRYEEQGKPHYGQVTPEGVYGLEGPPWHEIQPTGWMGQLEDLKILTPVEPSKIICIGVNYADHAAERGSDVPKEPVLFLKPPSTLIGPDDSIRYPPQSQHVDYEGELAVVIGKRIFCPDPVQARQAIFGYVIANDVTARDLQRSDEQWTRGKGFDTFCPVGPVINVDVDLGSREIETRLNGEAKQRSNVSNMVFDVEYLVHYCAQVMTLLPGDIILTGTPSGVGPMTPGDTVEVEIEGFGVLRNFIVAPGE